MVRDIYVLSILHEDKQHADVKNFTSVCGAYHSLEDAQQEMLREFLSYLKIAETDLCYCTDEYDEVDYTSRIFGDGNRTGLILWTSADAITSNGNVVRTWSISETPIL